MKSLSEHFIDTSDEQQYSVDLCYESVDPLKDISVITTDPRYYRINSLVFAEPLETISSDENVSKDQEEEEMMFIDNVIIQKKKGSKYKKYHINVEDSSQLRCPQSNCDQNFKSTKLLKAHIRKVHCTDQNKFICEQCGRGFSAQYLLERHGVVHSGKKVECPVCGLKLSGRTSLSSHLRCHSNLRPHQCEVCAKSFTRSSTLATHVKFVHRQGLLECDQCHQKFGTRKQWSQHMATHRRQPEGADTSEKT